MRIGMIGYGRFGRALSELLLDHGHRVIAYDSNSPPPEIARNLPEVVDDSEMIVVAVPLTQMRQVFEIVRERAGPEKIVVDVGSVKVHPFEWMSEIFGSSIPWVASHPLFGPVSLARAEQDLRVVICPNEHAVARECVASVYRSIGCSVHALDPEAHDRVMAQTHALAFFVAKGMLDAGVPADSELAPPSFQAMARTIESVRADAGHLLPTLHLENPYAAESRRALLASLSNLDRALNSSSDSVESDVAPLRIPDLSARSPELAEARDRIDEVDAEIMELLRRRAELARRAKRAKDGIGHGVVDPLRERRMLDERRRWADAAGLDPIGIAGIYEAIIHLSSKLQMEGDD